MKFFTRWPVVLLLITVGALSIRLSWRLSQSDTGWKPALEPWAVLATQAVGIERRPLHNQDPVKQAAFWLRQLDDVSTIDDPQLAHGAAWILDEPQRGFISRHIHQRENVFSFPGLPLGASLDLDWETIAAQREEFEVRCRQSCLEEIRRAVRLDPNNVELRRSRALLLFALRPSGLALVPREENWLAVLDECSAADPDNALYDYLAAQQHWTSSAEYEYRRKARDGWDLHVNDADEFEQGNVRFAAGLAKPFFHAGSLGYTATLAFLKETSLSPLEQLKLAESRSNVDSGTLVFLILMRWQGVQRDVWRRANQLDAAVAAMKCGLRISDQLSQSDLDPDLLISEIIFRRWSLANLEDLLSDNPDLFSGPEAARIAAELDAARMELEVHSEAGERLSAKDSGRTGRDEPPGLAAVYSNDMAKPLLTGAAMMLAGTCFTLAVVSCLISVLAGRKGGTDRGTIGCFWHMVAWCLGFGVSVTLLGLFPSEFVSVEVQSWLFVGIVWLGFAAVCVGMFELLRRWTQLSIRQILALAFAVSLTLLAVGAAIFPMEMFELGSSAVRILHPLLTVVALLLLGIVGWTTTRVLRRLAGNTQIGRRQKRLAIGLTCLIVIVAGAAGFGIGLWLQSLKTQPWIASRVWRANEAMPFTVQDWQSAMEQVDPGWAWVLLHWFVHLGAVVTPLIAGAILTLWCLWRSARQQDGGMRQLMRSAKRKSLRACGLPVARSCIVATLVFLIPCLWTAHAAVPARDADYRIRHGRLLDRDRFKQELAGLEAEVRADKPFMAKTRREIDERMQAIAEQQTADELWKQQEQQEQQQSAEQP